MYISNFVIGAELALRVLSRYMRTSMLRKYVILYLFRQILDPINAYTHIAGCEIRHRGAETENVTEPHIWRMESLLWSVSTLVLVTVNSD